MVEALVGRYLQGMILRFSWVVQDFAHPQVVKFLAGILRWYTSEKQVMAQPLSGLVEPKADRFWVLLVGPSMASSKM